MKIVKGATVETTGLGRTATWPHHVGTVTQVGKGYGRVAWHGLVVEHEMAPDEVRVIPPEDAPDEPRPFPIVEAPQRDSGEHHD